MKLDGPSTDTWLCGPIVTADDRLAADELYQRAFGYRAPEFRLNPYLLTALQKGGGSVIGAKDGDGTLVGMVYGFHASDAAGDYHYSQATVVDPGHQGLGIGERLKRAQRDYVIERTGVGRMRWTFAPSLARNAHFNLAKLGATAVAYDPEYYGLPGSERLLVEWTFAGDRYQPARDFAARAAPSLPVVTGAVRVARLPEPRVAGSHWVVFAASSGGGLDAELGRALDGCFREGAVLCWSGRVGDAAAYFAVPGSEGSHVA